MANWTFNEVFNIQLNIKCYSNVLVLGQTKNVVTCQGYLLFRNINCAAIQDTQYGFPEIYAISTAGKEITVEEHLSYSFGAAKFINNVTGFWLNKGLNRYDDTQVDIKGNWTGSELL